MAGLSTARELSGSRTFTFAERPLVDSVAKPPNRSVQLLNRKELPIPQCGDDPTLGQLYTRFDLGFVTGLVRPCRNHSDAVMHRHLLISRIQIGIVPAGFGNAGLGVVRHHQLWHALIELEGPYVSADPACQLLVGSGFGVGVRTGSQHSEE
jgi:hypothetical protein